MIKHRESILVSCSTAAIVGCLLLTLVFACPQNCLAQSDSSLNNPETYRWAQNYMLQLINEERSRAGLHSLRLDSLASQAAKLHSDEMLAGDYLSHWNIAGQKPSRRFNLLGGYHALSENIFYHYGPMPGWQELVELEMETLINSEGHRAAILDPDKTHVGLGFAAGRDRYYSSQEFISRRGGEYSCPLTAEVGESIEFSGRFDPQKYEFAQLLVSFEEPEQARSKKWLDNSGSYRDGDKLIAGYVADPEVQFKGLQTFHDMVVDEVSGKFAVTVKLDYKAKPGMYFLLVWLLDKQTGSTFNVAVASVAVAP